MFAILEEARSAIAIRAQNSRRNQRAHAREGEHFIGEETSRARAEAYEHAVVIIENIAALSEVTFLPIKGGE